VAHSEAVEYEAPETEAGRVLYWVNVLTGAAALVYYLYLMRPADDVVPFKNKAYHYGSKAAETLAAWSWDMALKFRRSYRAEVDK
jgi:hypothetical protein